ncbi:LAQU0S01e15236g1_1 [Lachancea quebecensis]|uniref:LAQU0S01e15236g1_1 n=1 Tax=Lachancea quebecensis TaxID=1654605 RepID=A0A0P1KMS3_9SACH|nr:LAQU0S01e15236g1_1 [Lachancea quebecensis]
MDGPGSSTMTMAAAPSAQSAGAGASSFDDWLFPEASRMGAFGEYGNEAEAEAETGGWAADAGVEADGEADLDADADGEADAEADVGAAMGADPSAAAIAAGSLSSSSSSSSAGSPLDQFSSLFDSNAMLARGSDSDTLFTASNSASGSPTFVKREDAQMCGPAGLGLGAAGLSADGEASGSLPLALDKRAPRKRLTAHQKQAHNKIEKRYRININTKIAKLQQIIPWVASEETAFEVGETSRGNTRGGEAVATATPKLNKSMILEKAVDYILYLQNNERLYEMEVQRLKKEVERARTERETAARS